MEYSPQYPPSKIDYYVKQIINPSVMCPKHIINNKYNIQILYLHQVHKMEQFGSQKIQLKICTYKNVTYNKNGHVAN